MPLQIHGSTVSTCTQRVLLVLGELGLSSHLVEVNMMKGEHKSPDFLKNIQPFGKIPTLDDGSLRIFESRAICRYLVAKYAPKDSPLSLPVKADDIAAFEQVASVECSYFDPNITKLAYEKMFKRMMGHGEPDAATVNALASGLGDALDHYDKILSKQSYLTRNEVSLVDLFHVPWLALLPKLGMEGEISSRKNVLAWSNKLQQRASWQQVLS